MSTDEREQRVRLIAETIDMATPIPFDDLERRGILAKDKGSWWRVLDWPALPRHVRAKAKAIKSQQPPNGPERILVRFYPPSAIKKAQRLLQRVRPEYLEEWRLHGQGALPSKAKER